MKATKEMNDLITFTKSVSTKFVESGIFGKEGEILKSKDSFSFQFSSSENEKFSYDLYTE